MTKESHDYQVTILGGSNMPKETFFNLPPEKRERIESSAIKEFRDFYFDASSINRIVEEAGIAKGSFYQYFEDKKDLYKHVMNIIIQKKMEYMTPTLMNPMGLDIFSLIKEMYASGLSFAFHNPDLLEISNKLLSDPNHDMYKELVEENKEKSDQVFLQLLKMAEERGEIRSGLDLSLVAYLLTSLNISVSDYYMRRNDTKTYSKDMLDVVDRFIDVVKYGIKS
jgi:AcrR family transcriptional regulator